MPALLRSARNLPTWWHERDRRRRPARGTPRPGAAAHRPAAHARGLGAAPPSGWPWPTRRLEGLARTDPLTGVPNRRVWEEELPGSWSGPGGWAPGCAWP